jgi:hypothetical protein
MSIFQNVEQFFENLWANVLKPDVQKAEVVVGAFFQSAETAVENELGVEGLMIVTDAVSAAEQSGGSGTQKLAAAQLAIATDLSTANLVNVAQTTINVAIEGAVAQLKTAQSQSTSQQQSGGTPAVGNDNSGASSTTGSGTDTSGSSTR